MNQLAQKTHMIITSMFLMDKTTFFGTPESTTTILGEMNTFILPTILRMLQCYLY